MAYERLVSAKWESLMYQAHNKQILNNYTLEEAMKHGPTDAKKWNAPQTIKLEGIPTCIFIT
jgi:hypothetical protein